MPLAPYEYIYLVERDVSNELDIGLILLPIKSLQVLTTDVNKEQEGPILYGMVRAG